MSQFLCFRTFAEAIRPHMKIKSKVMQYDHDGHRFFDNWNEQNLKNVIPFNKLLLNALLYRWEKSGIRLPDVNDYMASRLNTGNDEVNEKIVELAQESETAGYVCDYFEANLISNMVPTARNEALDAVLTLIAEDKTIGKTNIERFKRFRKNGAKSDALFLAEVLLYAVTRTNKVETDDAGYSAAPFASRIDGIRDKEKSHKNPFHYLNANLGFYGREKEIEFFQAFLDAKDTVSTLAITGYAGSGKSKFMYEFIAKAKTGKAKTGKAKWKFVYLDKLLIYEFSAVSYNDYRYERPLCIVIDYAGRYAEKIGSFLAHISNTSAGHLPTKIRFVLLERQGITQQNDGNEIYPDWFRRILNASDTPINLYGSGFLELVELSESALKAVALDYRNEDGVGIMQKYDGDKGQFEAEWNRICEMINRRGNLTAKIRTIRPLIVLFMIDSSIRHLDYYKWDIDEILKNIIDRYEKHWEENLCAGDKPLFNAVKKLLMYSTACESWVVGDIIAGFEAEAGLLNELGREKLSGILPYINEYEIYEDQILAFEPDLMGEFFVLDMLKDMSVESELSRIVKLFWETNADSFAFFLQMCVDDYSYSNRFKGLFEQFNEIFLSDSNFAENGDYRNLVAGILLQITYVGVSERTEAAIKMLGELVDSGNRDEYLTSRYVFGLYNQCHDVDVETAKEIIEDLRVVAEKNQDDAVICGTYCEALYNHVVLIYESVTEKDSKATRSKRINDMEAALSKIVDFIDNHTANNESAMVSAIIFFTRAMCNASIYLKRQSCVTYFERAVKYIEVMQAIPAVELFAHALADFAARTEIRAEDILPFYENLKEWIKNYENTFKENFIEHIDLLTNLVSKGDGAEQWLAEIDAIYKTTPSADIVFKYAMALNNLTYIKAEDGEADGSVYKSAIERIKILIDRHGDANISEWYCKAYYNYFNAMLDAESVNALEIADGFLNAISTYMNEQNEEEFSLVVELWCETVCNYGENRVNLTVSGFADIIGRYPTLFTAYPEDCALIFLQAIASLDQGGSLDESRMRELSDKIKHLYHDNKSSEPIARCYLESVSAISRFITNDELRDVLPELTVIHNRYSHEASVSDSYVLIIANYTPECDPSVIAAYLEKAIEAYNKHPDEEEMLANCLSILDDYVLKTEDIEKTKSILNSLKSQKNFNDCHSDSFKETYSLLLESMEETEI